jgi:hypothetical protein
MLPALRREIRIVRAIRRVGPGAQCSQCGECRPDALIVRRNSIICYRCDCVRRGLPPFEYHHPAGHANDPLTVAMDNNNHKVLTAMQDDWPIGVRSNATQDPLIKVSGRVRGLIETCPYIPSEALIKFIQDSMAGAPELLESLSRQFRTRLGKDWWT